MKDFRNAMLEAFSLTIEYKFREDATIATGSFQAKFRNFMEFYSENEEYDNFLS